MAALVVSIHDVSPLTQPDCERMLQDLAEAGVGTTSLLVIPDHHRRAPVANAPGFQQWLTKWVMQGHEPVLHGYYHSRDQRPGETLRDRWTTKLYTAGEGEFYDLDQEHASRLLRQGLADFRFLSRPIAGFIAPAWLLGEHAKMAVRTCGFRYTTTVHGVENLVTGRYLPSRSLVWSTRAAWRRWASIRWNEWLDRRLQQRELLRIGLHPPDRRYPEIRKQVLEIICRAARERQPMSYEQVAK
jgi:predicted deacetylase